MSAMSVLMIVAALGAEGAGRASEAAEGNDIAWRVSGPGGGGWIQSIAWDPHEAHTLYVGCDVGGFYRSDDGGQNYQIHNVGLHDYFIESIAVHPVDRRILLLGTESGIHRSTDGGRSWQWIREGFPPTQQHSFSSPIGSLCFDPLRPNVVYAGVGRPRMEKDGAGAIYRSTDTGLTWRRIAEGQLPARALVSQVAIQPGQSKVLLAATDQGIFRSEDGGVTWRDSSEGLVQRHAKRLAFAASSPTVVYATLSTRARDSEPFDGGVYRSDDAGRHWRAVNGPGLSRRVGKRSDPAPKTSLFVEVAVDPRDANVVYVGNSSWVAAGLYKTTDGGEHWALVTVRQGEQVNMDYGWITPWGPSVKCISLLPGNPDCLAFGTSGHVFVSTDAGRTWQPRYSRPLSDGRFSGTGLEVTCMNNILCDPVRADRRYYCYFDIGLLISDDGGQSFRRSFQGMANPGNCFTVVADPESRGTLWAGTGWWARNAGDVCMSEDDGQTWQVVGRPETGLPDGQTRHMVLDRKSPVGRRRLIVTCKGHGVYESEDGGRRWSSINGDLPAEAIGSPAGLMMDEKDPRCLTVALSGASQKGGGIYTTADGGKTWRRRHGEVPFADIECVVQDARDHDVLYVGAREYYDHKARRLHPGGLYKSTDGGRTWSCVLEDRFVKAVAVSGADSQVIYAGTNDHPFHDDSVPAGLLKSNDGGATWQKENRGLTLRKIMSITVDPQDRSRIYVGTSGNSVQIGKDSAVGRSQ
jgi:photosystem II stability/assembly factor-like uncharacterized protein